MTKWGAKARVMREAECYDDLRYHDINSGRQGIHKFKARQRVTMVRVATATMKL